MVATGCFLSDGPTADWKAAGMWITLLSMWISFQPWRICAAFGAVSLVGWGQLKTNFDRGEGICRKAVRSLSSTIRPQQCPANGKALWCAASGDWCVGKNYMTSKLIPGKKTMLPIDILKHCND